ncbi:MAG: hypothetical protein KDE27_14570 [Planctomycetes bacterium]|nr:hypothetical protein [Planctomycetota bacterium]
MRTLVALVGTLVFGACAAPRDAFERAQRSLGRQDLPAALVAFDAVPVSHVRYPEARVAALAVEQRMRRGHELLLEALLLRAEWRDREALAVLRQARAVWPRMPGVDALITATESRVRLMQKPSAAAALADAHEPAPVPVPVPELSPSSTPAVPTGEVGADASQSESDPDRDPGLPLPGAGAATTVAESPVAIPHPILVTQSREPATELDPVTAAVPSTESSPDAAVEPVTDSVALGLVAVETRLGRGDLEAAVADLIELSKRYPEDARVRLRLARVLHQRALQRYGHGQLAAAIVDWERVVALDPSNAIARSQLAAARAEADPGSPRR